MPAMKGNGVGNGGSYRSSAPSGSKDLQASRQPGAKPGKEGLFLHEYCATDL